MMTGMRFAIAGLLLLAGCDRFFQIRDRSVDDAGTDGPATQVCLGGPDTDRGGLLRVCVDVSVPARLSVPADVDTGQLAEQADCTKVVTQDDAEQTEVCVIAAYQLDVTRAVRAHGARPLVLVAIDDLTIASTGSIDVKSRVGSQGAGANVSGCFGMLGGSGVGGGGGAGGSFAFRAGSGGIGGGASGAVGGIADNAQNLGTVRGGCRGGGGGATTAGAGSGTTLPGNSGGAIYLIAGATISVAGTIEASGGPGQGGAANSSGRGAGGGGGGSGGLIGLDAPTVEITDTAKLSANGGGGGGGGSSLAGMPGGNVDAFGGNYPWLSTGGGGDSIRGPGGAGGQVTSPNGGPGVIGEGGGGGGGGGAGFIRIYGTRTGTGTALSPAAS